MKKIGWFLAAISISLHWACGNMSPMGVSPPNPSNNPNTVTAMANLTFSPSTVTIMHGAAVTFVLGGGTHTLYIDNGAGTCAQSYTTWPQIITFSNAGTYHFHCSIHSGCGTSSCSGCTGMTGEVVVQ